MREKLREWSARMQKVDDAFQEGDGEPTESKMKKYQEDYLKLSKERAAIVRESSTGFVWVMYQK